MANMDLATWLLGFGLGGICCLAIVEKLVPVLPSYVLLMFLGIAARDGTMLALTIAAATLGSVAGALCWYALGRLLGPRRARATVSRFGRYIFLRPGAYDRLTQIYRQNHFRVTLMGQITPMVRIYLPLPAGVLRLEPRTFLAATSLGCLIWNTTFVILGHYLPGHGRDRALAGFGAALLLVVIEASILYFLRLRAICSSMESSNDLGIAASKGKSGAEPNRH